VKRLSVTLARSGGGEDGIVPDDGGQRGSLRNVRVLRDGTVVELCRFAEPVAPALDDVLETDGRTIDHAVVDDHALYVHLRPGARAAALLDLLETHRLLLDAPVGFDAARVTVRLVGPAERISAAAAALPADVREALRVDRLAEYAPGEADLRERLTDRQRDVLAAAVEAGYYATPRAATVDDVADALDLAVSTTSEHLRKLEARVLPALVADRPTSEP